MFGREEFGKGRGGVGGKKGRWDEMRWGVGGLDGWRVGRDRIQMVCEV
jgi:hypothetical protein